MARDSKLRLIGGLAIGLAAVGVVLALEKAAPLRRTTREKLPRMIRNGAMGAACQAVIMLSEAPLTHAIARKNALEKRGVQHLFAQTGLGGILGKALAFLVMDYGFYLWHVSTHKNQFLWRFHRVHHIDPDLDASTAFRFHFIDMLVSLPWRLVQVRVSGLDPAMLSHWEKFFLASVIFHHSNIRLPKTAEKALSAIITTPAMHGIHHSATWDEMDSNWSSGISFWDHLHGTFRDDVDGETISIGVDDPKADDDVAILPALTAPLRDLPRP